MKTIAQLIRVAARTWGLETSLHRHRVWDLWGETVGPAIARVTAVGQVRFRTVYVNVCDSVWMQQLTFMEEEILQKLNEKMQGEGFDRIFFRLGSIRPKAKEKPRDERRPCTPLSEEQREEIRLQTSSIRDEGLRSTCSQLLERYAEVNGPGKTRIPEARR